MTRARVELAAILAAALALLVFLAWYQGQRARPPATTPLTDTAVHTAPAVEMAQVLDTTLLSGPLDGTIQEAPAPEVPPAVVEQDREFIAEAFPALSSWSLADVKPLLSTAALNATTDVELQQVMTTLSALLGTLQYFDEPQPTSLPQTLADTSADASLQPYRFTAYYEAGAAEVNLVLATEQQHRSLYSFDIHVPNP